ncbi:glycosyltransferase family 2 protein [Massilia sp. B-10]|nr:glycosyltransferase family 2 protein [Massilia sp. B-10]
MSRWHAIDVLIPTRNRSCGLAVTLTALSAQDFHDFRIVVSDQSDMPGAFASAEVRAVLRYLAARGSPSPRSAICRGAAWPSSAPSCWPRCARRAACSSTTT